jgi:hypothetical protein
VSISKIPAPQTVRAGLQQPQCFAGFKTQGELVDRVTVRRAMVCQCGGTTGILEAMQGWDGFPYADPLSLTCLSCETPREFFNSHRDGYDNVMGNGATSHQGHKITTFGCEDCGGWSVNVTSDLLYNIDADEIDEELGDRMDATPSDCFDAINVHAKCIDCGESSTVGGWELA